MLKAGSHVAVAGELLKMLSAVWDVLTASYLVLCVQ
jgi:hypothetical protein